MRNIESLTLAQLKTDKEDTLFAFMALFGISSWIGITISLVGLLYALFIGFFLMVAHQLYLANVRGDGVKVSPEQLPDLHARVVAASKRLGLTEVPEVYVMQAGGALNAMATKIFSRKFVILYSDLVDACSDDMRALDFVIGHEIGHIALGHLKWRTWLAPAWLVPLLGPAYSRACEYSCDRCGLAVAGEYEAAARGLAVLAAGGKLARHIALGKVVEQATATIGFWFGVMELNRSHPFLSKRVRALQEFTEPGTAPALGRSFWSYPLAPVLGFSAAGAGAAGGAVVVMMMAMLIGIFAAVAIPNVVKSQARANQAEAQVLLERCNTAQQAYHAEHDRYATTLAALGMTEAPQNYTLYMGATHLGPSLDLPDEAWQGMADGEAFVCVAVGNLDNDETFDLWTVDSFGGSIQQEIDDIDDQTREGLAERPTEAPEAQEAPSAEAEVEHESAFMDQGGLGIASPEPTAPPPAEPPARGKAKRGKHRDTAR